MTDNTKNNSSPALPLGKYERTRIIADRAEMISHGAPLHVPGIEHIIDPVEKARIEYYAGKCPLYFKRFLPEHTEDNPKFEIVRASDGQRVA